MPPSAAVRCIEAITALGVGEHHADPLGVLERLDDRWRAAGDVEHLFCLLWIMGKGRHRQAGPFACQDQGIVSLQGMDIEAYPGLVIFLEALDKLAEA